jgi:hypothetical protein
VTHRYQVSGKVGGLILVLGADTYEELATSAMDALGEENVQNFLDLFRIAFVINADAEVEKQAKQNVIDTFASAPPTQAAAPAQGAAPATPTADGETKSEIDKFGREWIYGIPGAASCSHGPMVRMNAKAKESGKPYSQWKCLTQSPVGFRQKATKSDCPAEFIGGR